LEIEENRKEGAYDSKTKCFGLARLGYQNQRIHAASMGQFLNEDMDHPYIALSFAPRSCIGLKKKRMRISVRSDTWFLDYDIHFGKICFWSVICKKWVKMIKYRHFPKVIILSFFHSLYNIHSKMSRTPQNKIHNSSYANCQRPSMHPD
jgi:hypothetical protein